MPITEMEWAELVRHQGHEGVEITARGIVCFECQDRVLVPRVGGVAALVEGGEWPTINHLLRDGAITQRQVREGTPVDEP